MAGNDDSASMYSAGSLIAGRYEVVQGPAENPRLKGGMGVVYLCADHRGEGLPVALKTFHREQLSHRGVRDRFLREGDVWVQVGRHPHVVRARRVERVGDGREVYLVLDWVAPAEGKPGASLREWLRPGQPLTREQALDFALQIVRGMRYACEQVPGLVHRDLKPENVLVGRDGRARVTDFGLAQALAGGGASPGWEPDPGWSDEAELHRTQLTQGWVGTPAYMAPEQWAGGNIDVRADVYGLGCMVVEMLTGVPPVLNGR